MSNSAARAAATEAVASSLTELFSPNIIGERVAGMLAHYDFVSKDTLAYFSQRPPQAKRDADFALQLRDRACEDPCRAGSRRRGARIQMRRACGRNSTRYGAPMSTAPFRRAHGRPEPPPARAEKRRERDPRRRQASYRGCRAASG